jgi:cyclic lactone autoinducer peptide
MKNKYTILAGGLTTIATVCALVMASAFWTYQPEIPNCLKQA